MKTLTYTSVTLAAAAIFLAVGVGSAAASSTKISIARTNIGRVLVDGRGHTLYLFQRDARGKSTCAGACAAYWPPLIASGKPLAGAGVRQALLGTTKRRDGRLQVTYNHHPLYGFVSDVRRGDTTGEGLNAYGGLWYAVSAAGAKTPKSDTAPTTTGTGSTDYGNGYDA
jgi:predicted lipoprotein with Yx(FWY)xxD motif